MSTHTDLTNSTDDTDLAVAITGQESAVEAAQLHALAQALALPICNFTEPKTCKPPRFILSFIPPTTDRKSSAELSELSEITKNTEKFLALSNTQDEFKGHVYIDFVHGKLAHRREFGGGRGQPLARAIGLKHGINPNVVDATAGLGRDAFVLASLGAHVTMIERSPILAALLNDGMQRLTHNEDPELADVQLQLIQANAIDWLQQQAGIATDKPDVVYLDPMYPHRSKSALVKKEMRALRALVGDDEDAAQLLQAARRYASKRVVVKRPKGAPLLDDTKPSGNVQSKNTRYDIYTVTTG